MPAQPQGLRGRPDSALPRVARAGPGPGGHLPLTLARVQDELLVAPGADAQLVLRGVEDVQEQVALPGAVARDRAQVGIF